ncbi:Major Facilitator Superfamily (MFS) [Thraustotheca clavata]|uniref:Major Facilitator Superfamily (MFS) n=1 Tax=Thraustotheca clavata TaxID=74557 RepID=A0A1V9YQK8_9STRA|nr:Major Facilitator Superfamily (MFS) [Thraustotheca clavata]
MASSALDAQRLKLQAERNKMRSKPKIRSNPQSIGMLNGPPGLTRKEIKCDEPTEKDLNRLIEMMLPSTSRKSMRLPTLTLKEHAGYSQCFEMNAFGMWVTQHLHLVSCPLSLKQLSPEELLKYLIKYKITCDLNDGWIAYVRKMQNDEAFDPKSMTTKTKFWTNVLQLNVYEELAKNIQVVIQPEADKPLCSSEEIPRLVLTLTITLRDTTWNVQRCMGQFGRMYAKARECMELPPFAGVQLEHARLADVYDDLHATLQKLSHQVTPWQHPDFVSFFDNERGYLTMLTQAQPIHTQLETLRAAKEKCMAKLRQYEETIGRQQTLINTLSSSKPSSSSFSYDTPSDSSSSFPSLLLPQPQSAETYSSSAVWENTTSSIFSASRHSTHTSSTASTSNSTCALSRCSWVPSNSIPCAVDMRLSRIISMVQPTSSAICHRIKASQVVCKIVKRVLGVPPFVTGASAARMFLPDCHLKMSVFLPPTHFAPDKPQWYMKLNEALCVASSSNACEDENLMIRNVELVHDSESPRLRCCVGKVSVLIEYGAFTDVRGACFLEAMDRLVGKCHLFKRSVLLVHSWLVYESGTNVSITDYKISSLLTTYTLSTMMLYVFNIFHTSLHHPLQALARFFGTYSAFPWDDFVVSLDGPRDLSCIGRAPKPPCHERDLLIQPSIMHMYQSCHLSDAVDKDYEHTLQNKMLQFEVKYFNVMDPLDPSVNLGANITAKEASTIRNAFDLGANKIHQVLVSLKKEMSSTISTSLGATSSVSLIDTCFPNVWKRFQCGWRPDCAASDFETDSAISNDVMMSLASLGVAPAIPNDECADLDPLCGDEDALRGQVLVCDFLLQGHVTPHAVFTKTVDILNEKGPLPIGEIGKCLQDATANTALSVTLKEQFGGLKKFLEQYPCDFIISDDHPYNPKVYVQSHLLDENMAATEHNKKKHKCTRRKKTCKPSTTEANVVSSGQKLPNANAAAFIPASYDVPRSTSFESTLKLHSPVFIPEQFRNCTTRMVKKRVLSPAPLLDPVLLPAFLKEHGMKPVHANKIWKYIASQVQAQNADISIDAIPQLPKELYPLLKENFKVFSTTIAEKHVSQDGTIKLLVTLQDGHNVEAVIMKHSGRNTLCVSSQVGCQMGCTFCATGTMGIIADLAAGEILEQLAHAFCVAPIRNVVFMGMGEPLNNYDAVLGAIKAMTSVFGLAPKYITLSTVGVIHRIRQLKEDAPLVRLALSLHAPTQELRVKIVPTAKAYPLDKLMAAIDDHLKDRENRMVMMEYIMLRGVNDSIDTAHDLGQLLKDRSVHVNLIPYNATEVDAEFQSPTKEEIMAFHAVLRKEYDIKVTVRENHGMDIDGACGQLAVKKLEDALPKTKAAAQRDIEDLGTAPKQRDVPKRSRGPPSPKNNSNGFFSSNLTIAAASIALIAIPVIAFALRNKPMHEQQHLLSKAYEVDKYLIAPVLWYAFSMAGGLIYGYNVSIAPSLPYIADSLNLSTSQQEMASAAATFSDCISMLVGGRLADIFGRRKVALLACSMSIIGALGCASWHSKFEAFLFWRLCTGVGNGLSILIVPMYVAESTTTAARGLAVAFFQLGVLSGTVLPYIVMLLSESWVLCMLMGCVPALLIATSFILGIFQESHAWEEWKRDMATSVVESNNTTEVDDGSQHPIRELWVGILLAYSNNSIDAPLFYGPQIVARSSESFTRRDANLVGMVFCMTSIVSVIFAMVFLVQKYSRRHIYLVCHGSVVLALLLCFFMFTFVPSIDTPNSVASNVLMAALSALVLFQTCGPGLLFVLIVSEMFGKGSYRARYMSYCTFSMSLFSLLINGTTLSLFESIGVGATFGSYGLSYAVCFVVFYKWLPETKSRGIMDH